MQIKQINKCVIFLIILPICFSWSQSTTEKNVNTLFGPYFNLSFPSTVATRFAPNIFTEELHAPPIFSPDGEEVYWSLMSSTQRDILYMKLTDGIWSDPAAAPFSFSEGSDSPFISSDGTKLFFLSVHNATTSENIWLVEKVNGVWGIPNMLGNEVNQAAPHWQASMADNNNLYYGGNGDIYFSEYQNGNYTTAQKLGAQINTDNNYETAPFIARDESYLIYGGMQGSSLYSDLLICFKQADGSWSEAIAMTELNTEAHELYANVSPDGRFLMFLSGRTGILLPYWVDAQIINNYITDVDDKNKTASSELFQLHQNFPNPFNPTTTIKYSIPASDNVKVIVYDLLGNEMATILNEVKKAGTYNLEFNADNLASGIYIYRIDVGNQYTTVKKMILLK
jgi:Secretion system C-terminal sorting domain/WD40-like Beta Propeller Repeat